MARKSTSGTLAIYVSTKGSPRIVPVDSTGSVSCTYDDHGEPLVDGAKALARNLRLCLAKFVRVNGSSNQCSCTVPSASGVAVRWDGKYVAVAEVAILFTALLYATAKRPRSAATTSMICYWIGGLWIQGEQGHRYGFVRVGGTIRRVCFYAYPAGGEPISTIPGTDYESGVTVERHAQGPTIGRDRRPSCNFRTAWGSATLRRGA